MKLTILNKFVLGALLMLMVSPTSYASVPRSYVLAAQQHSMPPARTKQKIAWIVCKTFKNTPCIHVLNVAWCESGLNIYAQNGQYKGLFQMGSSERARFGHAGNAWIQARAAYKYYLLSSWSPWECKP